MYYVYILQQKVEFYIGFSDNLRRRLKEHIRDKKGWSLVYYEAYPSFKAAKNRERRLKHYGSAWRGLKKRITA